MAEQDSSVSYQFTKLGNDLSVKALAGTVKLDFTKAELSTDNHFNDTEADVAIMTGMGNVAQTVELKEVDAVEDDQSYVKVPVLINEAEITEDYALMTIGLYCKPDDGDEVLYSICSLKDPIYMHKSSNNSTFALNLNTLVGSAASVVIKVDPAGMVTNADFDAFKATMGNYALKSDLDDYLKTLPANVALTDKANTFTEQQVLSAGAVNGAGKKALFDGDVDVPSDVVRESELNVTTIPNGTDLFTIYGEPKVRTYLVSSNNNASTMVNRPTGNAFTMTVKPISYNAGKNASGIPIWNSRLLTLAELSALGKKWEAILSTSGDGSQVVIEPWTRIVKESDTANWQKTKITADTGMEEYVWGKTTDDLTKNLLTLPIGLHTIYANGGCVNNPAKADIRGLIHVLGVGSGVGYIGDFHGRQWSVGFSSGTVTYNLNAIDNGDGTLTLNGQSIDISQMIATAKQQAIDQIQPLIDAEFKKRNVPSYFWSGDATAYAAVTPKVADADYSVFGGA